MEALLSRDEEPLHEVRRLIARRFEAEEVLLTDSGTSALTLALRTIAGDHPDGPVALPGYCCYDVATAAVGAEVPVLLYDLDPETLSPDLDSLAECIEGGARAIVVAHLYGMPVDLDVVLSLAGDAGIPVIEDAAQGAGGRYEGRPLGSFGALSVLSFGRGKGTTGCGGGALLGRGSRGGNWVRTVESCLPGNRPLGWKQAPELLGQWVFGRPELYGLPSGLPFLQLGETVYREPTPASRMSRLSGGVLVRALRDWGREVERRRRTARDWRSSLQSQSQISPIEVPGNCAPGYLRFPVLAEESARQDLQAERSRTLGVMPGYPEPLEELEALQARCLNRSSGRSGAERLSRSLFTLPTHSLLTRSDRARLKAILSGHRVT